MLNINQNKTQESELEKNMIFVGTIYDTFEALEETLGKLKLEKPLFLTYIAKQAFAEEVFARAKEETDQIYLSTKAENKDQPILQ
ncbi:MAG TPA: hypothetical protein DIC64_00305 [Alphaproteobacteria bacterium]|nr:hypothetical protein [Alphaproteobacteria bacterium]